jgi:hypothetical protein
MIQTGIFLVTAVLILATLGLGLYVLVLLYKEKGIGHALLGFFISPYAYIWGWINAKRLQMIDIMAVWTLVSIMAVAFPVVISVQEASKVLATIDPADFTTISDDGTIVFNDSQLALGSEDAIDMGSIQVGGRANGEITDLFAVHNWTFTGTAGQTVTIQGNAAGGDATDPRINLLGPDGALLAGDDDNGQDSNALISSFTLPANGQYTIQLDVWQTGRYEIVLN